VDDEFEIIAIKIRGMNPKSTWEVVGIYRAPNEDMRVIERLAARTGSTGNCTKRSIIGGDLNLPYVDWKGKVCGNSGTQPLINRLIWENDYNQVIDGPTRGYTLLDVFMVRPESVVTYSGVVQGISDHQAVILEVKWKEMCRETQAEKLVQVYSKTDIIGLQIFLWNKF
jgi:hypothetical protein